MLRSVAAILFACLGPSLAHADVKVTPIALRDYALPEGFPLSGALIASGLDETTFLANTTGEGTASSCTVVKAARHEASAIKYQLDSQPTGCVGMLTNPNGGVFLRVRNPLVMDGAVSGATVFINGDGVEAWKVRDTELVAAEAQPSGTGAFLGDYLTPFDTMAYSPTTNKLIAFTIGKLTINQEDKFIAQAHIVDVATGELLRSGQNLGQAGLGVPIAATVRDDGIFVVAYDTLGLEGLLFYNYDGRETVEELKPLTETWENRSLAAMFWAQGTLNFVWLDPTDANVTTHVAATNANGNDLLRASFESTYRFADGAFVVLGPPTNAWRDSEYIVVSHVSDGLVYLRFVTPDGDTPGVGRLDGITAFTPAAVVSAEEGLRFLAYDEAGGRIYEYALTFMDVGDYDPTQASGEAGIPDDVGISDVLDEVGCGCTTTSQAHTPLVLALTLLGALVWRRR